MEKVIAVAMSGGVDSSLTAAMLLKQGYKVFGITLWLWVSGTPYDEVPLAVTDAKKMCDFLGIEHHVIDARDVFYENVVDYFVKEYAYGRTPNPCVFCNKNIKFDLMLNRALELGATHMVTGHYAQVNYNEETGVLTVGNWANGDSDFYHLMRTSDTLPAQFQVFYEVTQDPKWLDIKEKMLKQLDTISSQSNTGLLPDFIWVEEQGTRVADPNTIESKYDGSYSYNACRLPYNLVQSKDPVSQKMVKKMLGFFNDQRNLYAGYDLKGKALNNHQAASFLAPIIFASEREKSYLKLVQQNKYIFTQDLPLNNYYDATMTTMIALELF